MAESLRCATDASAGPHDLLSLKSEYLLPCVYHFYKNPPQIVRASDCTLFDSEGREYIDCFSGVTVMSAGHCNPAIIEPAIQQIRTLQHTTTIYLTEPQLRLAEAIATIAPRGLKRSFFCASGSEATEGAMMLACHFAERPGIVSMTEGLHGRTRWAMNATGLQMWRSDPFPLENMWRVDFGDIAALRDLFQSHASKIAAVIAEPIQGNGGIVVPPESYWEQVRALCDEYNVLLILDEVQTGFNRTGTWFACEQWDITPDILCMSKALGNGFPIAAFITTDQIAEGFTAPSASTHGGNPVSATAALATIAFHQSHQLGSAARIRGRQLFDLLERLHNQFPNHTQSPRGLGLMLGLPVVTERGEPDAARTDAILENLKEYGILAGKTGPGRNVLTFMPPLTISEESVERIGDGLGSSLRSICN